MSSFKNIMPRREHRERLQPSRRIAKHGLLEKKKDYKVRARDANRKSRRLKLLREKAAFRNPDEFYHAMSSAAPTDRGRVRKVRDAKQVGEGDHHVADGEVRRLVETQDRAYVRMKIDREKRCVEKAKGRLHFLEAAKVDARRRHIVYVGDEDDDEDEGEDEDGLEEARQVAEKGSVDDSDEDDGALIERKGGNAQVFGETVGDAAVRSLRSFNRNEHFARERARVSAGVHVNREDDDVDKDVDATRQFSGTARQARRVKNRAGRKGYVELNQRMDRASRLDTAMEDLVLRQHLLGKGARRKVSAGDPEAGLLPVFKWRKQRKR